MRAETFEVGGMTCGGCVAAVTKALKSVPGVKDVAVSLKPCETRIEFDEGVTSLEHQRATVKEAGNEVEVSGRKGQESHQ